MTLVSIRYGVYNNTLGMCRNKFWMAQAQVVSHTHGRLILFFFTSDSLYMSKYRTISFMIIFAQCATRSLTYGAHVWLFTYRLRSCIGSHYFFETNKQKSCLSHWRRGGSHKIFLSIGFTTLYVADTWNSHCTSWHLPFVNIIRPTMVGDITHRCKIKLGLQPCMYYYL